MRRSVVANKNWFEPKATTMLSDVCYRSVIQSPECVFVECIDALRQPYLYAIGQQIVLSQEILRFDLGIQFGMFFFSNGHDRTGNL